MRFFIRSKSTSNNFIHTSSIHLLCRSGVSTLSVLQRCWGYSVYSRRYLRCTPSLVRFQAIFSACDKWKAQGGFGGYLEVGHVGASRPPPPKLSNNISLCMHSPSKKHRNTGCIIKSVPLRAYCQQCVNREERPGEALAQEGLSLLEKSLSFQSERFSVDEVNNPVDTVLGLPKHCELLSNYDLCFIGLPLFGPSALLEQRDRQHIKQTGAGYIRDRALHCYCCFILLTQLGKQPTLALSIQAHRLQHDPDSSAHTSASDKGSHGASGDSVKKAIHDKVLGGFVPPAAEVISRVFSWAALS